MNLRTLLVTVVAVGIAAATTAVGVSPAQATSTWTSVAGTGVGSIPDGDVLCTTFAGPLVVSFSVTGMPVAPLSGVRISGLQMTHPWVGDLDVELFAPNASGATVFSRVGSTAAAPAGDSSNLGGTYSFSDESTPNNLWSEAAGLGTADVIPSGRYAATTPGAPDLTNGGQQTSLTQAFSSVADPNGTWTLEFADHCGGDTGSVTAVTLQLQSSAGLGPCTGFAMELNSAQIAADSAASALTTSRDAAATAAETLGAAKATASATAEAGTRAQAASTAAQGAVASATGAVTKAATALKKAKKSHRKAAIARAAKALKAATIRLSTAKKTAAATSTTLSTAQATAATAAQDQVTAQGARDAAVTVVTSRQATLAAAQDTLAEKKKAYAFCLDA
ncbi:hypothetical protein GCM10009795_016510 [Nocardioides hankookensis]